jgi:hypothetical protein
MLLTAEFRVTDLIAFGISPAEKASLKKMYFVFEVSERWSPLPSAFPKGYHSSYTWAALMPYGCEKVVRNLLLIKKKPIIVSPRLTRSP